jgi:hypothetical protein
MATTTRTPSLAQQAARAHDGHHRVLVRLAAAQPAIPAGERDVRALSTAVGTLVGWGAVSSERIVHPEIRGAGRYEYRYEITEAGRALLDRLAGRFA